MHCFDSTLKHNAAILNSELRVVEVPLTFRQKNSESGWRFFWRGRLWTRKIRLMRYHKNAPQLSKASFYEGVLAINCILNSLMWHRRALSQKPRRFAPCLELPASCKLQVPLHSRRITPPISLGLVPTANVRSVAVRRPSWDETLCHSRRRMS